VLHVTTERQDGGQFGRRRFDRNGRFLAQNDLGSRILDVEIARL